MRSTTDWLLVGCLLGLALMTLGPASSPARDTRPEELYLPESSEDLIRDFPGDSFDRIGEVDSGSDSLALVVHNHRVLQLELMVLERRIHSLREELKANKILLERLVADRDRGSGDTAPLREIDTDTPEESTEADTPDMDMDTEPNVSDTPANESDTEDREVEEAENDTDLVHPNEASMEQLQQLPGVTDRLARRIDWYRSNVGLFEQPEDLRQVPGLTEENFQSIREHLQPGPYEVDS